VDSDTHQSSGESKGKPIIRESIADSVEPIAYNKPTKGLAGAIPAMFIYFSTNQTKPKKQNDL